MDGLRDRLRLWSEYRRVARLDLRLWLYFKVGLFWGYGYGNEPGLSGARTSSNVVM